MEQIAPGIHQWTAPHPEWRTSVEEVVSYALVAGETLALVDPLLPTEGHPHRAQLLTQLDAMIGAARSLALLITIPYHTRSAETLYERYSRTVPTDIWGHGGVKQRLTRLAPLEVIPMGDTGTCAAIADGVAEAYTIGKPRRQEHPFYFPDLRAAVFGDAIVGVDGELRFWNQSSGTGAAWYRDVFAPTVAPMAERDLDCVLVTHGPPVVEGGRQALAACLTAPPVDSF